MSSSEILYNFGANASHIDNIQQFIQGIAEVKGDISTMFNALSTVYTGSGATALAMAHQKIDAMLDDALNAQTATQKAAQDQQDAMQALDRANAAQF
jgi:hypothetical protein